MKVKFRNGFVASGIGRFRKNEVVDVDVDLVPIMPSRTEFVSGTEKEKAAFEERFAPKKGDGQLSLGNKLKA